MGGSGVYAQYCVARLAREHGIKVLLDGQGADEQLAGYRKFILVYVGELARSGRMVRAAREAVAFLSSWEILRTSRVAAGKRYLRGALPETSRLWEGTVPPDRPVELQLDRTLGQRLQSDLLTFSLPLLLRYEDRNTMAFGVESRVPFVDHVLVEWVAKLPADLRLSPGWTKRILREGLTDLLPPMVRHTQEQTRVLDSAIEMAAGAAQALAHRDLAPPAAPRIDRVAESVGAAR